MKKMLALAALCAGVFVFSNTTFAEAADQQKEEGISVVQNTDVSTQQLSTTTDDERRRR